MLTYMIFVEMLKEHIIEDALKNGDDFDKAMAIFAIPVVILAGIIGILFDILTIPLYLIVGLIYLIIKIINR